jgi:hypothetical protein
MCLVVFPARQDGWTLNRSEPLLSIAEGWTELFPALRAEQSQDELRTAWLIWARSRSLPEAEAAACPLGLAGHQVKIQASPAILERLHKTKSDVFKGDTWLLIGDGPLRTAMLLDVQ